MSQIRKYLANYLHLGARLGLATNVSRFFWDFFNENAKASKIKHHLVFDTGHLCKNSLHGFQLNQHSKTMSLCRPEIR